MATGLLRPDFRTNGQRHAIACLNIFQKHPRTIRQLNAVLVRAFNRIAALRGNLEWSEPAARRGNR